MDYPYQPFTQTYSLAMIRLKTGSQIVNFELNKISHFRRMSCVARGVEGNSFLTGVFDGHAGPYRNGYFVFYFFQLYLIVT